MSASAIDAAFFELCSLTSWDRDSWDKFLELPPELQKLTIANYREQDWTKPGTSTFDRVLEILGIIGSVASVVGGVAGAAGAVAALRSL